MKVDMSPEAIENRLKLVGELTKSCLLIRQNTISKTNEKTEKSNKKSNSKSENLIKKVIKF